MKERLVLDFESSIEGRTDLCMIMESLHDFDFDWKITRKAEQIPETWEELKELCKGLKGVSLKENRIIVETKFTYIKFYDNGDIEVCCEEVIIKHRTPAQMWQIIQGLVSNE